MPQLSITQYQDVSIIGNIEFDIASSYIGGVAGYFGNSMLIGCEIMATSQRQVALLPLRGIMSAGLLALAAIGIKVDLIG